MNFFAILYEFNMALKNETGDRFFDVVGQSISTNRLAVLKSALLHANGGAAKKRRKDHENAL